MAKVWKVYNGKHFMRDANSGNFRRLMCMDTGVTRSIHHSTVSLAETFVRIFPDEKIKSIRAMRELYGHNLGVLLDAWDIACGIQEGVL